MDECSNGNVDNQSFKIMLILGMITTLIVAIVGSIGNLMSLATIIHQFWLPKRMRYIVKMTANNILITNLCLADLCYCTISLPILFFGYLRLYSAYIQNQEIDIPLLKYDIVCKWAAFVRYTNAITEWTSLGVMALERGTLQCVRSRNHLTREKNRTFMVLYMLCYRCVTIYRFRGKFRPSKWFSSKKTLFYCISLWLIGMSLQAPTLLKVFGMYGFNYATLQCDIMISVRCNCSEKSLLNFSIDEGYMNNTTSDHYGWFSPRNFFFCLESAVPCTLILVGYIIILNEVYNSKKILSWSSPQTTQTQISLAVRRSKTTRMIILLLSIYLVCVIPLCVYNAAIPECELSTPLNQNIGIFVYCVYRLQYALNNFVYVYSNERYKLAYKQLCCFLSGKKVMAPARIINPTGLAAPCGGNREVRLRTPSETILERESSTNCFVTISSSYGINFDDYEVFREAPILKLQNGIQKETFDQPKRLCSLMKTLKGFRKNNNALALKHLKLRTSLSLIDTPIKKGIGIQEIGTVHISEKIDRIVNGKVSQKSFNNNLPLKPAANNWRRSRTL